MMEQLLQDPELIQQLDEIERSSSASTNAYCSRQATIEFCRMMWRLSQEEGTNPYKEMKLLEDIISDPELKKVFSRNILLDELFLSRKESRINAQHDMQYMLKAILQKYQDDERVREFCRINTIDEYIKAILDFNKIKQTITDPALLGIKQKEIDSVKGVVYGLLEQLMWKYNELSLIDLGGGNGDKAKLLITHLPFKSFTYLNIDISPYMSAIASKNLETLAEEGIQITQNEDWSQVINDFQKILLMSEQDKVQIILKEAYDCASILESIKELRSIKTPIGNFSIYCTYKIYEILLPHSTSGEIARMKQSLEFEKEIETRRLDYSTGRRVLTDKERVNNQEMINFTERTLHELLNKFHSSRNITDETAKLIQRYSNARHFALYDWVPIVQRCYDELMEFSRIAQGQKLDEKTVDFLRKEEMNKYLISYFKRLVKLIKNKDFENAAKLHPYPHIKSAWMSFLMPKEGDGILRDVPNNDNNWIIMEAQPKKRLGTYDAIFGVSQLEKEDVEYSDGESFGPNKLERVLLEHYFKHHKTIITPPNKHIKYCNTSSKGITLDFMDFEKAYKATQGIASGILGTQKMYLLLGQTLGNYSSEERALLVQKFYDNMHQGDFFLVGVDMAPDCKTPEARELRLKQMKLEYSKGEDFVRASMNSQTASVDATYDEANNDIVIMVNDNEQSREFFRSHKFSHKEITELLQHSGFKILGAKYHTNPREVDFGLEYGAILCQKVEE